MYIYLDKSGTVKEIINDEALRQSSSNVNTMHVYFEGYLEENISEVLATYELPSGTILDEAEVATETTTEEIPYNAERDLKYFKYYTDYPFYVFDVADLALAESGVVRLTIRMVSQASESISSMGLITFDVEQSIIKADYGVSVSQYNYLVKQWMGSVDGNFLPLDGSKPMRGDLNMASYFIKLNGLYIKNENGKLTFNGSELAKKSDVVTLSGNLETITGSKNIDNAYLHFQGEETKTYIELEDGGSDYKVTISPTSVKLEGVGVNTYAKFKVSEKLDRAFLELSNKGNITYYNQDSINYNSGNVIKFPAKSGTFALLSDIPTDYATQTYVDNLVKEYQPLNEYLTSIANTLDNGTKSGYLYFTYDGGQYRINIQEQETELLYNATVYMKFQFVANNINYIAYCCTTFITGDKFTIETPYDLTKYLNSNGYHSMIQGAIYVKDSYAFYAPIVDGIANTNGTITLNTYGAFGTIILPADGKYNGYVDNFSMELSYTEVKR